jgi:hypothetical protein
MRTSLLSQVRLPAVPDVPPARFQYHDLRVSTFVWPGHNLNNSKMKTGRFGVGTFPALSLCALITRLAVRPQVL